MCPGTACRSPYKPEHGSPVGRWDNRTGLRHRRSEARVGSDRIGYQIASTKSLTWLIERFIE